MTLHKLLCCANDPLPGGEQTQPAIFSASQSFSFTFLWRNVHFPLKACGRSPLRPTEKGIVCLCAHLQEQSLGGDVSVKLASLWLVKAAHPTRLRCFLWANGGRSCHSARVSFNSDYAYALSLQKPPLLLINDTLKENHSNTPLPAHRNLKKKKAIKNLTLQMLGSNES